MDDVTTIRPMTSALLAMMVALFATPAMTQQEAIRPEPRPADLSAAPAPEEEAKPVLGLSGPYLAARMATVQNDFRAASRYFAQAVAHDPGDRYLQDNALIAMISAGEVRRAAELARSMEAGGYTTELSTLVTRARMVHDGEWQALVDAIGQPDIADGGLIDGMIRAWALLGAGRASDALVAFDELSAMGAVVPMVRYHLGLARALVGDYEGAEALLSDQQTGAHLLGIIARAQILAQLDRRDDAVAMLDAVPGLDAEPHLIVLRERLRAGAPVPFDVVKGPADGIAQVFLTFASALSTSPDPEPLALIHARLAAWLSPDTGEVRLMVAQLLQEREQFDLAEAEFDVVRRLGEMRPVAELGRIDALSRAERPAEAEKAALSLTAAYPDLPQGWIALGDVLRQQEKFAQSVPAYDKALSLLEDAPEDARWFALYARGISLERAGHFDRAEADFLAAIEIRSDQPSLLNYLGYSWIDRNENLERGLDLIKKAAELAPGDGYILDSLAWAYYRLGRYEEAVGPMEEAVGTMSSDPLVNDHLGDIYWMVDRKREAEIQWRRALSLEPTDSGEVDPDRIRAKLENGLDEVLADEARRGGAVLPNDGTTANAAEPSD